MSAHLIDAPRRGDGTTLTTAPRRLALPAEELVLDAIRRGERTVEHIAEHLDANRRAVLEVLNRLQSWGAVTRYTVQFGPDGLLDNPDAGWPVARWRIA